MYLGAVFVCLLILSEAGGGIVKRYATISLHECRPPLYYNCNETINCIHAQYRCDGAADCPDQDDEANCADWECPEGAVKCSDTGQCIPARLVCNGCEDCGTGEDEKNCTSHFRGCRGNQFYCSELDACIPVARTCDGVEDCAGRCVEGEGNCTRAEDEECDIAEHQDIFLTEDEPAFNLTVNLTAADATSKIIARSWTVHALEDWVLYTIPAQVSLGELCGPSAVWLYVETDEAAQLCSNTFPPWRTGHISSYAGTFTVYFKFFNDFEGDEFRGFSLKFWQGPE